MSTPVNNLRVQSPSDFPEEVDGRAVISAESSNVGDVIGCKIVDGEKTFTNISKEEILGGYLAGSHYIGEIVIWPLSWAPKNWKLCDGSILNTEDYPELSSLLGDDFGGDGVTTFALPDLRGKFPLGISGSHALASSSGQETVTLTENQMPLHNHSATGKIRAKSGMGTYTNTPVDNHPGLAPSGMNIYSATQNGFMNSGGVVITIGDKGTGEAHDNMPPYLSLNFIICVHGDYPIAE